MLPEAENRRVRRETTGAGVRAGSQAKGDELLCLRGRAIRRIVTLYDALEDLIAENDRRCDDQQSDEDVTIDQERLQFGYIALNNALSWFHPRASELEYDEYLQMLKKLRQGADGARGDDTSKLKSLVADWTTLPNELDWSNPIVRAGIRDRADGYVVTEMSWPAFMYEKYMADPDNLEEGLFKSSLLVQAYKAIFTSPSSAKEVADEGDGADIIANNRRASKDLYSGKKVKMHVAQIIKMHKVTPRSCLCLCQLRFTLSSVTSWRSIDGDFDYIPFWRTIVDFFERPPGRAAQQKVEATPGMVDKESFWNKPSGGTQ
ncbi:hypothetical protein C8R48DRAFT_777881 [Suillus tomentosus]|nr:hypothetical protein C8R48DRAFT_777881 [Suillus tomentosus]